LDSRWRCLVSSDKWCEAPVDPCDDAIEMLPRCADPRTVRSASLYACAEWSVVSTTLALRPWRPRCRSGGEESRCLCGSATRNVSMDSTLSSSSEAREDDDDCELNAHSSESLSDPCDEEGDGGAMRRAKRETTFRCNRIHVEAEPAR
jgi:hypothetical protein